MIATTGRCDRCAGVVRNAAGRRLTRERLQQVHDDTCPGLYRKTGAR